MSRAASIIEINGTMYDATTGNVVGAVKKVASQVKDQSRAIDGFVRKSSTYARARTEAVKPRRAPHQPAASAKNVHSRTQRSHALMRTVVAKPRTTASETKPSRVKPSLSNAVNVEQDRRERASAITRHSGVKRFGGALRQSRPAAAKHRTEIIAKARPVSHQPMPTKIAPLPSMVASASHQKLERMLDEALVRADAHKQMLRRRSRNPLVRFSHLPRWLTVGVALLIIVLIAAIVAWRDVPAVAMKVASTQAHVNASLPSYTPSGFAMAGHVDRQGNAVTVEYASTVDNGYSYNLTQRSSSWDSSSLAANVLGPNSQVQTSQVQGTTVYIYGNQNNATWVNNGVWYTLKDNASLSSDQILRIVQSL